jgi:SAM-dependent methyltransferase
VPYPRISASLLAGFLVCACAFGQKPEYDFYPEFRNVFVPQARSGEPSISEEAIAQRYAAKPRAEGAGETEISRRLSLIRSDRSALESDYWNRFYLNDKSNFNRAPNGFLVEAIRGIAAGAALDYGMGEGRNAIYLASLGWKVSGFDPADAAVALARKRAAELGLTLDAQAVRDSGYEFGKERFDLILFSWSMPLVPVERVLDSLKPGGMVVMECAADFTGRNGMLKMFDALRIVRYEIVRAKADFYNRMDTEVLRMVAAKPR